MQNQAESKRLSGFLAAVAVMLALFLLAGLAVVLLPWLWNTLVLGRD